MAFSLLGFEAAAYAAGKTADARKTVPLATMAGTVLTGLIYVLACTAVVMMVPLGIYILTAFGLSLNLSILIVLVILLACDWYFDFSAVMALMTPVILIGGMTMGWFTPTEAAVAAAAPPPGRSWPIRCPWYPRHG